MRRLLLLFLITWLATTVVMTTSLSQAMDHPKDEDEVALTELDVLQKLAKLLDALGDDQEEEKAPETDAPVQLVERDQPPKLQRGKKSNPYSSLMGYQPVKAKRNQLKRKPMATRGGNLHVTSEANDLVVSLQPDPDCPFCRYSLYYYSEDDPTTAFVYPEEGPVFLVDEAFAGAGRATLSSYVTANTCYVIGQYIVTPEGKAALGEENRHCTKRENKVLKISMSGK